MNFPQRPPRVPAYEHCTVARDDGRLVAGFLLSLSNEGFCVESHHTLEVGERIEMRVMGLGRFSGIVRWTDQKRAGGVLEPFESGGFE